LIDDMATDIPGPTDHQNLIHSAPHVLATVRRNPADACRPSGGTDPGPPAASAAKFGAAKLHP
jgi:hypothetical protein